MPRKVLCRHLHITDADLRETYHHTPRLGGIAHSNSQSSAANREQTDMF